MEKNRLPGFPGPFGRFHTWHQCIAGTTALSGNGDHPQQQFSWCEADHRQGMVGCELSRFFPFVLKWQAAMLAIFIFLLRLSAFANPINHQWFQNCHTKIGKMTKEKWQ